MRYLPIFLKIILFWELTFIIISDLLSSVKEASKEVANFNWEKNTNPFTVWKICLYVCKALQTQLLSYRLTETLKHTIVCTHLNSFFPASIHSLQCILCLLLNLYLFIFYFVRMFKLRETKLFQSHNRI